MFKRHGGGVDDDRGASGVGRPATVMMEDTQGEPRQDNPDKLPDLKPELNVEPHGHRIYRRRKLKLEVGLGAVWKADVGGDFLAEETS